MHLTFVQFHGTPSQWNLRDTCLLIGIALCNCQLVESQRYMFINSILMYCLFYRIIEVLYLFYLLCQRNLQVLTLKFCVLRKEANIW